jgi:hypothetical protein
MGRPRLPIDAEAVTRLRAEGHSWRSIARRIGVGCGTVRRAYQQRAKTVPKPIAEPSTVSLGKRRFLASSVDWILLATPGFLQLAQLVKATAQSPSGPCPRPRMSTRCPSQNP